MVLLIDDLDRLSRKLSRLIVTNAKIQKGAIVDEGIVYWWNRINK